MARKSFGPGSDSKYDKQIALVLQGGGALGSYQAGVYEALTENGYQPDWVAGISIGAINAAIIAGNAPEVRGAKLREFWERVSSPSANWLDLPHTIWQDAIRRTAAMSALMFGQPGFFRPNVLHCWTTGTPPTSYYDTSFLKGTLERLVDFDRINAREIRFSVGAVNVRTGNFAYFDNARQTIRPEHVMASGALPPGFPAIEIDGEFYWDAGLVSNTPLKYILETFRYAHNLRRNISTLLEKLPASLKDEPEVEFLTRAACQTTMDIVELIYRPAANQGPSKDYEFLRITMERRWNQGLSDARATLASAPWLEPAPPDIAVRTFEVASDKTAKEASEAGLKPSLPEPTQQKVATHG